MKKTIIILVIVIVAVLVWYWWSNQGADYAPQTVTPDDTTGTINEELQGIDLGSLDQEFQSIDTELNSL